MFRVSWLARKQTREEIRPLVQSNPFSHQSVYIWVLSFSSPSWSWSKLLIRLFKISRNIDMATRFFMVIPYVFVSKFLATTKNAAGMWFKFQVHSFDVLIPIWWIWKFTRTSLETTLNYIWGNPNFMHLKMALNVFLQLFDLTFTTNNILMTRSNMLFEALLVREVFHAAWFWT